MNYQKKTPQLVLDKFFHHGINVTDGNIRYFAFPYTFGSTSGPHGGIGGQALSTFTVEAFESDLGTVYLCDAVMKFKLYPMEFSWPK